LKSKTSNAGAVNNKERLRFESLIQSYDLYSSEQFQNIKPIKSLLESNNDYRLGDDGGMPGSQYDTATKRNNESLEMGLIPGTAK